MKKIIILAITLIAFTSCQKQNIAYVDTGKVINEVSIKKDIEANFKEKEATLTKTNDSIRQAFNVEVQEASKVAANMRDQKKIQELSMSLQQKDQGIQRQIQNSQQVLANQYRTEIDSVITKVKTFVKDYGSTNGFDYIIGTSDNTATIMYGKDENDLTEKIIEAFNKENE